MTLREITDVYFSAAVIAKLYREHQVGPEEAREAMLNATTIYRTGDRSRKRARIVYVIEARTDSGRLLRVVFSRGRGGKCSVITAFEKR